MKKVYLYKQFERFWHWSQTLLVGGMIVTGFEIHSSYELMGFEEAVNWHNYFAWSFIVLIIFSLFWHFTTDQWKNYIPTTKNLKAQMNYYLLGIFKNAPHPTKKKTLSKLNPMQKLVYLGLTVIIFPVMVGSGLLYYYFHYSAGGLEVRSLEPIALFHTFGAFLLIVFLIFHVYLITTGRTYTSNLMAMISGWELMDDESTREILQEAIDEVSEQIKPDGKKDKKTKREVNVILAEILEKAGSKVKNEKTEDPQNFNKKNESPIDHK